jgi:hypothetical protein
VVTEKRTRSWSIRESWIARLLHEADIFSEGSVRDELDGRTYYGSTSFRCEVAAVRGQLSGGEDGLVIDADVLAQALVAEPQVRLVAVRIARREACARAGAALDVMHAEVSVRVIDRDADGDNRPRLAIDVDVSARLARLHARLASE